MRVQHSMGTLGHREREFVWCERRLHVVFFPLEAPEAVAHRYGVKMEVVRNLPNVATGVEA